MTRFYYFVRVNIHDLCNVNHGFRAGKVSFVKMGVPVKKIPGPGNADEPVQRFQSVVGRVGVVVDAEWGGMTDEDIERAPILQTVEKQAGKHVKGSQISFMLGILVDAVRTVADGTAKSTDQEFFVADNFEVQVESTSARDFSESGS